MAFRFLNMVAAKPEVAIFSRIIRRTKKNQDAGRAELEISKSSACSIDSITPNSILIVYFNLHV